MRTSIPHNYLFNPYIVINDHRYDGDYFLNVIIKYYDEINIFELQLICIECISIS